MASRWCTPAEYDAFKKLLLSEAKGNPKCYLCGRAVDPRLPHTNAEALTIDHMRPKQLFPNLVKDPRNLVLAHRRCNASKGMRTTEQAQADIKRQRRGSRPEWA